MIETCVVKLEQQIDKNSAHEQKNALPMAGTIPPPSCITCRGLKVHCAGANSRKHAPSVSYWDISMAHRIAVKPKIQGEDKGNIMFKLCNRYVKQHIFKSCNVVKPDNFYINESLTPLRNTILYVMWQTKKKHPSVINMQLQFIRRQCGVWLHAASASAKTKSRKIIINVKKELDLFLLQELNVKTTAFIDTWPAF